MNQDNQQTFVTSQVGVPVATGETQQTPIPEIAPVPMPKKGVSKVGVLIGVLILFLLVGGSGVAASMIAYDKITVGNAKVQMAIRDAVMSIPFLPKTATYVIEKSAIATTEVKTMSLDASVALTSPSLLTISGSNNMDASLKGTVDRTDVNNVKSSLSLEVGSLFAADLKSADKKIYAKVNTFPSKLISSFIQIPEETWTNAFSKWIVWDSNSLDTEARKLSEEANAKAAQSPAEAATQFLNNKMLMSKIALTTDTLDGNIVYKLHPTVDAEFVNAYVAEFGTDDDKVKAQSSSWLDSLKDFNFDVYVDKSTYIVRKVTLSFGSKGNGSLLTPALSMVPGIASTDFQVAAVMKLSDFGKSDPVEIPTDSKSWQDVFSELTSAMGSVTEHLVTEPRQIEQARDTQRRADLLNITSAIYQYAADHNGTLPAIGSKPFPTKATCIGTGPSCFDLANAGVEGYAVAPTYTAIIPKDPLTGTDDDHKYTIYTDATGRLQAEAQSELDPKTPIKVTR